MHVLWFPSDASTGLLKTRTTNRNSLTQKTSGYWYGFIQNHLLVASTLFRLGAHVLCALGTEKILELTILFVGHCWIAFFRPDDDDNDHENDDDSDDDHHHVDDDDQLLRRMRFS